MWNLMNCLIIAASSHFKERNVTREIQPPDCKCGVGGVMVGGRLGLGDHEMVVFRTFAVMRKRNLGNQSRIDPLNFKKANFRLFWEVYTEQSTSGICFWGLRVHECWSVFRNHLLEAQEQASQLCGIVLKELGRRPAWLKRKKPLHGLWKRG